MEEENARSVNTRLLVGGHFEGEQQFIVISGTPPSLIPGGHPVRRSLLLPSADGDDDDDGG